MSVTARLEEWLPTTEPGLSTGFPLFFPSRFIVSARLAAVRSGREDRRQMTVLENGREHGLTDRATMFPGARGNFDQHPLAAFFASDVAVNCWRDVSVFLVSVHGYVSIDGGWSSIDRRLR